MNKFTIETIDEENLNEALECYQSNPMYYEMTQEPFPTLQSCLEDIYALPNGKELKDKSFVLIKDGKNVCAVIDFIGAYPNASTGFIGLFMIHGEKHKQHLGTTLYRQLEKHAATQYTHLRLACYETNTPGINFWQKMGFEKVETKIKQENGGERKLIVFEKKLIA